MIRGMYTWNEVKNKLNSEGKGRELGGGAFSNLMDDAHITPTSFYQDKRNTHRGLFTDKDIEKLKKLVEKRGLRTYNKSAVPPLTV